MTDVRDILFREIADKKFRAVLTAERSGVFCGRSAAITCAQALGIELEICKNDGDELSHGQRFANLLAKPKQVAIAEEQLIGTMAKACGIATAARTAVHLADCNVTRSVSKMTEIEGRGGKRWDKPKKAEKSRDCRGGKF